MNRLLLFLILCIASTSFVFGQQYINTYNIHGFGLERYLVVDSYYGVKRADYLTIMLQSHEMIKKKWKITATVTSVTNNFPVEMLHFNLISKSGSSNVSIIDNFNYPLQLNNPVDLIAFWSSSQEGYQDLDFNFEFQVMGGVYLKDFPRYTKINFVVEYSLYVENGNSGTWEYVMALQDNDAHFDINIDPNSQVPVPDPVYSLTVSPEVLLEFNTISSYMNGVEKTCEKGLKVSASGNYEVRAKSQTSQFTSTTSSRTLPLDLVSLQLSGGNGTQQPVNISTTNQLILQGTSTNGNVVEYDMIYKAKPIEDQYLKINGQETFTTQLMFELTTN
jgi:hypothetical protein